MLMCKWYAEYQNERHTCINVTWRHLKILKFGIKMLVWMWPGGPIRQSFTICKYVSLALSPLETGATSGDSSGLSLTPGTTTMTRNRRREPIQGRKPNHIRWRYGRSWRFFFFCDIDSQASGVAKVSLVCNKLIMFYFALLSLQLQTQVLVFKQEGSNSNEN